MKKGDKVGIVCCSNGQAVSYREKIECLRNVLEGIGLVSVFSECIYERQSVFGGTAQERAGSLMRFYEEDAIKAVFDISGGDIANELLPFLDYDVIAGSEKLFWGYSDLTTVMNAIYAKTGRASVLYQVRNLIYADSERQISNFTSTVLNGQGDLFSFDYTFVQGEYMEGIVAGGNIRCFLKLAGTPYFPDINEKILLLEGYHGTVPQMVTYLNQLKQMGVFDRINGILLGTFTEMESKGLVPSMADLVKRYAGTKLPIAMTGQIGHGVDSKAIMIGEFLSLKKR